MTSKNQLKFIQLKITLRRRKQKQKNGLRMGLGTYWLVTSKSSFEPDPLDGVAGPSPAEIGPKTLNHTVECRFSIQFPDVKTQVAQSADKTFTATNLSWRARFSDVCFQEAA